MDTEVQTTNGSDNGEGGESERPQPVKDKPEKEKAAESQPSLVGVKVIHTENKAALVEFMQDGEYKRVVVPAGKVEAGSVSEANLAAGAPYGQDWSKVEGMTPEIVNEFHRHGIWTDDDLLKRSQSARGALQKILVVPLLTKLLAEARTNK